MKPTIPGPSRGRMARLLDLYAEAQAVVRAGRPADAWLTRHYREHREYGSRDRRFYSDSIFAAFRWRGWLNPWSDRPAAALALAAWLDGNPPPPVMLEACILAGGPAGDWPPPPAVALPDKAIALAALAGCPPPDPLAVLPDWCPPLLDDGGAPDPAGFRLKLADCFQRRPPLWLRALDGDSASLAARLAEAGWTGRPGPAESPGAVRVDGWPALGGLERRIGPRFEVQDLSSQLVARIAGPRPGESWWDSCSGAGGKTLHLAALAGGRARLLATDVRPAALEELKERARRAGLRGLSCRTADAAEGPPPGTGPFDGVLVDAPCSGIGTWSRNPDMRWRTTAETVLEKSRLQRRILDGAARAVKPGGRLVYAVCTLTRPECTDTVESFLARHPDFVADAPPRAVLPWEGPCDGMFIAAFRKRS